MKKCAFFSIYDKKRSNSDFAKYKAGIIWLQWYMSQVEMAVL